MKNFIFCEVGHTETYENALINLENFWFGNSTDFKKQNHFLETHF